MKLRHLIFILFILVEAFGWTLWRLGFSAEDLAKLSLYLDLANPSVKVVQITEGMRKEEIANRVGNKLGWSDEKKQEFLNYEIAFNTKGLEGKFFPKTYLFEQSISPAAVSLIMLHEFNNQAEKIEIKRNEKILNQDTMLKIASIIQRESGGKRDMALISGIIWNRLFAGMKLQMDATLQYAKGSEETGWWPKVVPADKNIESEYNTYKYKGLPPGAIANPGIEAIKAAYNPAKTKCLFYLHDRYRRIHCSETYEGHLKNIKKYL